MAEREREQPRPCDFVDERSRARGCICADERTTPGSHGIGSARSVLQKKTGGRTRPPVAVSSREAVPFSFHGFSRKRGTAVFVEAELEPELQHARRDDLLHAAEVGVVS